MAEFTSEVTLEAVLDQGSLRDARDDLEDALTADPITASVDSGGNSMMADGGQDGGLSTLDAAAGSLVTLAEDRNDLLAQLLETMETQAFEEAQGGGGGGVLPLGLGALGLGTGGVAAGVGAAGIGGGLLSIFAKQKLGGAGGAAAEDMFGTDLTKGLQQMTATGQGGANLSFALTATDLATGGGEHPNAAMAGLKSGLPPGLSSLIGGGDPLADLSWPEPPDPLAGISADDWSVPDPLADVTSGDWPRPNVLDDFTAEDWSAPDPLAGITPEDWSVPDPLADVVPEDWSAPDPLAGITPADWSVPNPFAGLSSSDWPLPNPLAGISASDWPLPNPLAGLSSADWPDLPSLDFDINLSIDNIRRQIERIVKQTIRNEFNL